MSCIFQYTSEPRADGKREAHCIRCGQRSGWTLSPLHEIHAACRLDTNGAPLGYVGNELKALLTEVGISGDAGCGCDDKAALMNAWGIAGCKEHRGEIIDWLRESAAAKGWAEKIKVGVKLLQQPWFNPLDAYGSIVDEAIRRAEARATARLPSKTTEPLSAPLQ